MPEIEEYEGDLQINKIFQYNTRPKQQKRKRALTLDSTWGA